MNKKILVTGGTGLIGKEILPYLTKSGYEVYAVSTGKNHDEKVNWIKCDLFDTGLLKSVFEKIKPEYLINFAWITGGDYLTNPVNLKYKDAGIKMLHLFTQNGGKRAIYAGTCFEYETNHSPLKESDKTNPETLYAKCKDELHQECQKFAKDNDISFAWGRIFYVYGHNEKYPRLTAGIIDALKNNKPFTLNAPNNFLDYMYSKDIAKAFLTVLESNYNGTVNICTGKGILLKDYALKIQEILRKNNLILFDETIPAKQKIIGDNSLLKSLGFKQDYTLDSALNNILKDCR